MVAERCSKVGKELDGGGDAKLTGVGGGPRTVPATEVCIDITPRSVGTYCGGPALLDDPRFGPSRLYIRMPFIAPDKAGDASSACAYLHHGPLGQNPA